MHNEETTGYRDLTRIHHLWGAVFRDGIEIYRGTSFANLCNNLPLHPTANAEAKRYQVFRQVLNFGKLRFELLTGVTENRPLIRYDTLEVIN